MTKVSTSATIPVLVLGTGLTALAVIRAFGRKRIPAYLINNESDDTAIHFSRWFHPLTRQYSVTPDTLAEFLGDNNTLKQAVLMPCADPWVEAVAGLPSKVSKLFSSTVANPEIVSVFLDKWLLAQALTKLELPHPHTVLVSDRDTLGRLPESAFVGVFLKPRNSTKFAKRFNNLKGAIVQDRIDVVRWFAQIQKENISVVLQEYIPGPPTEHYFIEGFIDRTGKVRALFARRRIRMHPNTLGNSSYVVSVPLIDVNEALETLLTLLRSQNYRGIFSAEFKHDSRDGKFKLLEVNVRPWWYIEFAQWCNVDICGLAYNDALRKPLQNITHYKTWQYCVYPKTDFSAYFKQGERGGGTLFSLISSWIFSKNLIFSWDDPLPAIVQFLSALARGRLV